MTINITCNTPEGITKGKGQINFAGKKSSGWFEMNIPAGPAGPMKMKNSFTAKYIRACN